MSQETCTIYNHDTSDPLPQKVYNHGLKDAAPEARCVVNHDIRDCSTEDSLDKVLGVHHYAGRVLGSTGPEDIIQLPSDLQQHWPWISDHYAKAGISHTEQVIWDDSFTRMADFPGYEPSVFFFGKKAHAARPDQNWFDIVQHMNSKNLFIAACRHMGVRVPETWCYETKAEVQDVNAYPFPCYLKMAVSVSGLGVVKCESSLDLERELSLIEEGVPFQIQKEVNAFSFLNLQYRQNGKLERYAATEQVLKGCCHAGNAFPTKYQPWDMTDALAAKMVSVGMRGYFAFDIAACEEKGEVAYYAIECNPRYNGSSYPTNIAKKIGAQQWVAKKVVTTTSSLSDIDLGELQYTAERGQGVIFVNWGSITENELGVLFVAPTAEQQNMLEHKLQNIV